MEEKKKFTCKAGLHDWSTEDEASKCCNGWKPAWKETYFSDAGGRIIEKKLVANEVKDDFMSQALEQFIVKTRFKCTTGHAWGSEDEARRCCNGWTRVVEYGEPTTYENGLTSREILSIILTKDVEQ